MREFLLRQAKGLLGKKRNLARIQIVSWLVVAALAIAAAAFVFLLLGYEPPPDKEKAFPNGEIVIGVDASFPPFALDDGETLEGLDIDLARAIGRELGLPIRFVNIGFYSLYDALISGRVDLLISALRVDPARMDDVRYTRSYFDNGLVLVTAADAPPVDFERIAYEYASSADSQLRAWESEGRVMQRLPYELPQYALDALRLKQADAALVDAITYRLYQKEQGSWRSSYRYITQELYAAAIQIDRIDAWKLVDGAMAALKERGELARILEKWL